MVSLLATVLAALVAIVLAGLAFQAIGSARDRRRFPPPGVLVDVGGRRLHARIIDERGEGGEGTPTVVFESGIAASSINWSRVQAEVAGFAKTVSYDRAGYAWSDPAPGPRTAARAAGDLRALLDGAGVAPPYVLVGHSFGGLVLRAFVDRYPDDVAGLVFVDSTFPEEWLDMPAERGRVLAGGATFARLGGLLARLGVVRACLALLTSGSTTVPRVVARGFGRTALVVLSRIVGEVQKMPAEARPAIAAHWSQPKSFASMASHLANLPASAAEAAGLGTFGDRPVVVLSAAELRPELQRLHDALAAGSSNGRHIVATTAGHWIQLDEPRLVVQAIADCVDDRRKRDVRETRGNT